MKRDAQSTNNFVYSPIRVSFSCYLIPFGSAEIGSAQLRKGRDRRRPERRASSRCGKPAHGVSSLKLRRFRAPQLRWRAQKRGVRNYTSVPFNRSLR
jgi:hypothetical protein